MNLYEIMAEIEDCIDYETGEVDIERLSALEEDKKTKIKNIGLWIKNLKAEVTALKDEKAKFDARIKSKNSKIESLTKYLEACLNGEKYEDEQLVITYRKSEKLELADDFDDERFTAYTPSYDKRAITKAIKDGEDIKGAMLLEYQNMQIK